MSHATEMVEKLEALMKANPGASAVTVDGVTVQMRDLKADWQFWKTQAAQETGTRPRLLKMRMKGF